MPSNYHTVVNTAIVMAFLWQLGLTSRLFQEIRDVFYSKRYVTALDVNVVCKYEMYQLIAKNKKQLQCRCTLFKIVTTSFQITSNKKWYDESKNTCLWVLLSSFLDLDYTKQCTKIVIFSSK